MFIRLCTVLSCLVALVGCSSSGLRNALPESELPSCGYAPTSSSYIDAPVDSIKTLFIHPGLMLLIDWGGDRALDVGQYLVEQGVADSLYELRSRAQQPMLDQMLKAGGGDFVGLHYSMGGTPMVVKKALDAAKLATESTGVMTRYTAVMVDPFGLKYLEQRIDLDNPHLREVYVVLSGEHSLLRPDPSSLSAYLKDHPKVHLLFAEEFGVDWNHFSFLSDVRNPHRDGVEAERSRVIFDAIVDGAFRHQGVGQNHQRFYDLKLRFAKEDQRQVIPGMCRLVAER